MKSSHYFSRMMLLSMAFISLLVSSASFTPPTKAQSTKTASASHAYLEPYQAIHFVGEENNIQRFEYDGQIWIKIDIGIGHQAAGDPIPFDNGTPHIVYRDLNNHLQLLFQENGVWQKRQITQGDDQRAKSDPSVY
ncbi:MAG: hypothetical protein AAGD96_14530, partial [Chloroflexota bacterium]